MDDLKSKAGRRPKQEVKAERRHVPYVSEGVANVLAEWVVVGNGVLCGVLAVVEVFRGRAWGEGMAVGGGYLPGLVMMVVMFARRELRAVDMSELDRLRGGGKGI